MTAALAMGQPEDKRLHGLLVWEPGSPQWLYHMVCRQYFQGRIAEALAWCRRLLAVDETHVRAASIAVHALCQRQMFADAIRLGKRCAAHSPGDDRIWLCLAHAFHAIGRSAAAVGPALHATILRPDDHDSINNLGIILSSQKRFGEARTWLRQALAGKPDHHVTLMNLASILFAEGDLEPATAVCRRILADRPDDAEALINHGTARLDQGRSKEAIILYRRTVALSPDHTSAHLFAAMAYLRLGAFSVGWDLYEWRWRGTSLKLPDYALGRPLWDGGDISGKTILLHGEQGLGDSLQFCRYVPLVAQKAKVLLAVPGALVGLMDTLGSGIQVLRDGEPLPPFDLHCPLMSLARLFRTTSRNVPQDRAYLRADPQSLAAWRRRLEGRGPRIGLAWSGNPAHVGDGRRSLPLRRLLPLIWNSGADWHIVQKDLRDEDRALVAATPRLTWHGDQLTSFDDTAALVSALDLVIAVDTSVAHLAGALGVPTWLMLPFAPDWRWLEDRDDSPWYGSVRLFRQPRPGDWDGVVAGIAEHLASTFDLPMAS